MLITSKTIFEWDIIVEKVSGAAWIGVCASENFDYETWAGFQSTGWILGSNGRCYNSRNTCRLNYCLSFRDNAKVTV